MKIGSIKYAVLLVAILLAYAQHSYAGPPFFTDDPQPVPFKHWEYYISSVNTYSPDAWSGTSPHFEVNYGLIKNVQIHLLLPVNYIHVQHQKTKFGYADTEFGVKYCFVQETDSRPQVGIFPILEIPTIKNGSFSDGKTKAFLPVWAQKSWDKFTTYGGAGYWINPGKGNKNSIFVGWELQYDFSKVVTLGGELYYQSADAVGSKSTAAFNFGGIINISPKTHFIFSAGHSIVHESTFTSYLGLLWTI
jgi:hypothetical protein